MKTSELIGPALDWAVAKCEGVNEEAFRLFYEPTEPTHYDAQGFPEFNYSTIWSQGGPIIERECIATYASGACSVSPKNPDYWVAEILATDEMVTGYGPTPLIAAMRCYCCAKLGDEIEIPEELQPCHQPNL
jgi:hypothetical protein